MDEMEKKTIKALIERREHAAAERVFDNCVKSGDGIDREYYDLDDLRLIVEDGKIIGYYYPGEEEQVEPKDVPERAGIQTPAGETVYISTCPKRVIETLEDTIPYMLSEDWKDRLVAEFFQVKKRLKNLIESYRTEEPPSRMLLEQEKAMRAYVDMLALRAAQNGVDIIGHCAPDR